MKRIVLVLGLSLTSLLSCNSPMWEKMKTLKYQVTDSSKNRYYFNEYKKDDDGCIRFKGIYLDTASQEGEFIICGSYTIKNNIHYGSNNLLD